MPIKKGFSRKTIGENIKKEMDNGVSKKQALAIALNVARKAAEKAGKPEKGPKPKKVKTRGIKKSDVKALKSSSSY